MATPLEGRLSYARLWADPAQVIAVDGDTVIVAPIINVESDEVYPPGTRHGVQKDECRIMPIPPIPIRTLAEIKLPSRDYINEFDELLELLRQHCGGFHEIRHAFEQELEEFGYKNRSERVAHFEKLVFQFYQQEPAEQKRILNGWQPHPVRPSAQKIKPGTQVASSRLAVKVNSLPSNKCITWHKWVNAPPAPAPALKNINTPAAQAITAVGGVTLFVEDNDQPKRTTPSADKSFVTVYGAYPKKVGKEAAKKAFKKTLRLIANRPADERSNLPPDVWLLQRVEAYAAAMKQTGNTFVLNPATFFNAGNYDDDPAEWLKKGSIYGNSKRRHRRRPRQSR